VAAYTAADTPLLLELLLLELLLLFEFLLLLAFDEAAPAAQAVLLVVLKGLQHHVADGALHVIGMAAAMDIEEFLGIELLHTLDAL